jgi:hypothetical protein
MLPDVTAKPDKVRNFVSHLLEKRGVPEEHLQKVVRLWTSGSGQEMRSYDPAMYLDIFGCQDGWVIYREVRLRIHEELCCCDLAPHMLHGMSNRNEQQE